MAAKIAVTCFHLFTIEVQNRKYFIIVCFVSTLAALIGRTGGRVKPCQAFVIFVHVVREVTVRRRIDTLVIY